MSVCLSVSFSMHSHSFQDTELKLHRYVNDFPGHREYQFYANLGGLALMTQET